MSTTLSPYKASPLPAAPQPAFAPLLSVKDVGPGLRVWVTGSAAHGGHGGHSGHWATVQYVGRVKFPLSPHAPATQVGVEFDAPVGEHDGSVHGVRYFTCRDNHGAFPPLSALTVPASASLAATDLSSGAASPPGSARGRPSPVRGHPVFSLASSPAPSVPGPLGTLGTPGASVSAGMGTGATADGSAAADTPAAPALAPFSTGFLYDPRLQPPPHPHAHGHGYGHHGHGGRAASPGPPPALAPASASASAVSGFSQQPPALPSAAVAAAGVAAMSLPRTLSPFDPRFHAPGSGVFASAGRHPDTDTDTGAGDGSSSSSSSSSDSGSSSGGQSLQARAAAAALAEMTTALRLNDYRGGTGVHRTWVWGSNAHSELTVTAPAPAPAPTAAASAAAFVSTPGGGGGGGGGRVVRVPMLMRTPRSAPVAQLGAGLAHTVALTVDGAVHTAGSWRAGVLGLPVTADQQAFRQLPVLGGGAAAAAAAATDADAGADGSGRGPRVVAIAVSDLHNVALLHSGDIVTWGGTLHGKLGRAGVADAAEDAPAAGAFGSERLVRDRAAAAANAAATAAAAAAVAASVDPASTHFMRRYDPFDLAGSQQTGAGAGADGNGAVAAVSAPVSLPAGAGYQLVRGLGGLTSAGGLTSPRRVVSIACGTWHTVIATAAGEVFTFGGGGRHNNFGQLGHGGLAGDISEPRRVDELVRQKVLVGSVAAGAFHTIALSRNGRGLWAWGQGDYGQLGTGQCSHAPLPAPVAGLASAGADRRGFPALTAPDSAAIATAAAVADAGEWGGYAADIADLEAAADEAALGASSGSGGGGLLPVAPAGECVIQVSCGDRHTVCLTRDGTVYTFGFGSHGQLGSLPATNALTARPVDALARRGVCITRVAVGSNHCLALSADKEVFAWGQGDRGQLGTGALDHSPLPVLLEDLLGEDICEIAAGGAHSLAYTRHFQRTDAMRAEHARAAARAEARRVGLALEEAVMAAEAWAPAAEEGGAPLSAAALLERARARAAELRDAHAAVLSAGLSMRVSDSPHVNVTTRWVGFRTRAPLQALRAAYAGWVRACRAKDDSLIYDSLFVATTPAEAVAAAGAGAASVGTTSTGGVPLPEETGFAGAGAAAAGPRSLHEHSLNSALQARSIGISTGGGGARGFAFVAFSCTLAGGVLADAAAAGARAAAQPALDPAQDAALLASDAGGHAPPPLFADEWPGAGAADGAIVVAQLTTRDNLSSGAMWALAALKGLVSKARAHDRTAFESEDWRRVVVRELKPGRR